MPITKRTNGISSCLSEADFAIKGAGDSKNENKPKATTARETTFGIRLISFIQAKFVTRKRSMETSFKESSHREFGKGIKRTPITNVADNSQTGSQYLYFSNGLLIVKGKVLKNLSFQEGFVKY